MNAARDFTVLLLLPLFYESARRVRAGVLDWVDQNPGWRVIELDPDNSELTEAFMRHIDGLILWVFQGQQVWGTLNLGDTPAIDCGSGEQSPSKGFIPAGVTFDRESAGRLAARHFHDLGLEVVGYVGRNLSTLRYP